MQVGQGMRQVVGFEVRSTERGNFKGNVSLWRTCAKVRELSELRCGVVRGVDRSIAVLDGGPRRARGR